MSKKQQISIRVGMLVQWTQKAKPCFATRTTLCISSSLTIFHAEFLHLHSGWNQVIKWSLTYIRSTWQSILAVPVRSLKGVSLYMSKTIWLEDQIERQRWDFRCFLLCVLIMCLFFEMRVTSSVSHTQRLRADQFQWKRLA